ncbi:hypothetical protein CCPUN_02550 [Cardinium endosymbiont of Culicoides punctatus]|nr:hypothetical protein CCPUN_02550 [Cardinium endosymbiont of Culicoides punctatus]
MDVDIIDHDNQGTLRVISSFTGRNKPVSYEEISKRIIIHDTPPYNSGNLKSLIQEVDLVLIPCNLMYPDLLALRSLSDELKRLNMINKGILIFNEIRQPYNNTYKEVKNLYKMNYPEIKQAKTELSNLLSFSSVLSDPISGKALIQITSLVSELGIF